MCQYYYPLNISSFNGLKLHKTVLTFLLSVFGLNFTTFFPTDSLDSLMSSFCRHLELYPYWVNFSVFCSHVRGEPEKAFSSNFFLNVGDNEVLCVTSREWRCAPGGVNYNSFLQDRLSTLFPLASSKEFTNIVT